ncbi:hypothetical protein ACNIRP_25125, partial [Escherichia coli]
GGGGGGVFGRRPRSQGLRNNTRSGVEAGGETKSHTPAATRGKNHTKQIKTKNPKIKTYKKKILNKKNQKTIR